MKEKIRERYYLFVGDMLIRIYERVWYYRWHHARFNWTRKMYDETLDLLTWSIIDNGMDIVKDSKKDHCVDITVYGTEEKSPFYGGSRIHAEYNEFGSMTFGKWQSI